MNQPSWLYQTPSLSAGAQQPPATQSTPSVMPSWTNPWSGTTNEVRQSEGWPTSEGSGWGGIGNGAWWQQIQDELRNPAPRSTSPQSSSSNMYEGNFEYGPNGFEQTFTSQGDLPRRIIDEMIQSRWPTDRWTNVAGAASEQRPNITQIPQNQQGGLMQLLQSLFSNMSPSRAVSSQYANLTPQQRRTMG